MSYSISSVIVGIPLSNAVREVLRDITGEDDDFEDYAEANFGFKTLYHGNSDSIPGFLGVAISNFDECPDYLKVNLDAARPHLLYKNYYENDISPRWLAPTAQQTQEARDLYDALPQEIKDVAEFGVYIIAASS